ncbi:ferredoxin [Actinomadura sp. GC306]|uniref:ferredoxin n=1 Tax=Actinomadura sp. GC306 TaxID=2530367 RepID=UPI001047035E|nr:ferredoxin [Actinomadura sp. GC306]TDC67759.1 ferredoxin [Actinomadura sp. GC306]
MTGPAHRRRPGRRRRPGSCAGAPPARAGAVADDGHSEAVAGPVPERLAGLVERAGSQCPEHAITVDAGVR